MDLVNDFNKYTFRVLEECQEAIASYPAILIEATMEYLKKLHLYTESQKKSGFCYLMPFWFMDSFDLSSEQCHSIAMGNCFALLYFMCQDEIFDGGINKGNAHYLPLSNLFYIDFIKRYRQVFSSESPFWNYFDEYIKQWAESILWERTLTIEKILNFSKEDFILLSRKAAPLKIPFAAVCILSQNEALIQSFANMMDYDQAAFQMVDDWLDWQDDLRYHNYTFIIAKSMEYCSLDNPDRLQESHIKQAIYNGYILEEVMSLAKEFITKAEHCIIDIDIPYVKLYLKNEMQVCQAIIDKHKQEQAEIINGGFNKLLNKLLASKIIEVDNEVQ
jgi:hypothetical protein